MPLGVHGLHPAAARDIGRCRWTSLAAGRDMRRNTNLIELAEAQRGGCIGGAAGDGRDEVLEVA